LGYTFAEIAAAFPAAFTSLGTNKPSYRGLASIQIGDTGVGTATTTLVDTVGSSVEWDSGKTLKNRATQTTSWYFRTGTKIGSGNQASGATGTRIRFGAATALTMNHYHYGSTFQQTAGAMQFVNTTGVDNNGEMVNCLLQSVATGVAPIVVGNQAISRFANIYNVDISSTTANQLMSNFNAVLAERITLGAATPTTFIGSGGAGVASKDMAMFGSPTQSDLRWTGAGAVGWQLYRPTWTGNAPKFTTSTAGTPAITSATVEYRFCAIKVVDRLGAGVASIPLTITDVLGNVLVNTTTDANGEITFGSDLGMDMIPVMDHYISSGTTYAQRHRGPYTTKVNTSDLAGYNSSYLGRTYTWKCPGHESVTTSAGQFEDVGDIVAIQDAAGNPTVWTEQVVP